MREISFERRTSFECKMTGAKSVTWSDVSRSWLFSGIDTTPNGTSSFGARRPVSESTRYLRLVAVSKFYQSFFKVGPFKLYYFGIFVTGLLRIE